MAFTSPKIDKVVKTLILTAEAQRHREKINKFNFVNSASLRLNFYFLRMNQN